MTYQLTPEAQVAENNKFKKCLPWLSFAFLPMLMCAYSLTFEFIIFIFGMCCMFCFIGYYAIKSLTNMRLTMRISLDGDKLAFHTDGRPDRTINRNEIKKVIEIPNESLQVYSINSSQVIIIPVDIVSARDKCKRLYAINAKRVFLPYCQA
jgi:hypothetical protein